MGTYDDLREAIREQALVRASSGVKIIQNESGELADWLFDFRALLLQAQWLNRYAEIFWEKYGSYYPFQVCGMESAGIPLVAAIVMKSVERGTPVNGFFIRKSRKRQGLLKQIEGTLTDEPIILVDDLVNSGYTIEKTLKVLRKEGKEVSQVFCLLSFHDVKEVALTRDNPQLTLSALFTLKEFGLVMKKPLEVPADLFSELWHFAGNDPSFHFVVQKSAPLLDEKCVYFGTDSGAFYALNQEDSSVAWKFNVRKHPKGKGIFSSPAMHEDTVYFGAYDGTFYALDRKNGTVRWEYSKADWIGSSPAIAPDLGVVFIGLEFGLFRKRGGIAALDLKTGKEIWSDRTPALTHGSPLYIPEEHLVAIGSNDGVAYGYDAKTGTLLWRYQTEGDIKTAPAYDPKRRMVLFASMDGKLYGISAEDGTPVFAYETGAGMYSTPVVHNRTVYITSLDKTVYATDLDTGKLKAEFQTNGRIFATPLIAEKALWVGSNDGRLYEFTLENLKLRSTFQFTERIVSKIAYNSETKRFFVPTVANELYCLERNTSG